MTEEEFDYLLEMQMNIKDTLATPGWGALIEWGHSCPTGLHVRNKQLLKGYAEDHIDYVARTKFLEGAEWWKSLPAYLDEFIENERKRQKQFEMGDLD